MSEQAKHGEGEKPTEGQITPDGDKTSSKSLIMMGGSLVILCFIVGLSISAVTATKEEANKEGPVVEEAGPEVIVHRSVLPVTNEIYGGKNREEEGEPLGAFFPFEPFVVNLRGGGFLRVQVQVELTQRDIPAGIIARNVILRDGIISLLSARTREDVLGLKARDELKTSILNLLNSTLNRSLVKKVYFTQFVAQ